MMAEPHRRKHSEKFVFFWQKDSPFSQWHIVDFDVDGVTYNCAEKFMMHQKAVLFKDEETAREILEKDSPKEQKALGRDVKNFDEKTWEKERLKIVKKGNMAKFTQNPELKKLLFASHPRLLVEASPVDRIWGIGLKASDPRAQKKSTWKGENLLGYALTEVREELMA